MKKMYLCPLNLDTVFDVDYLHLFIQYQVESSDSTLKGLLEDIGIPMTSYAYARKNGFLKSRKITDALIDYFNVSLEINQNDLSTLKELVWGAITESYFISAENLRNIQVELAKVKPKVRHTPLYLLYCLAYLSSMDHFVAKDKHKEELENEIIPFVEFVKTTVSKDLQYFYLFSLTEYYLVTDKDDLAITLIPQYEELDPYVDERLKTMGYYDLFTLFALNENYPRALRYLDQCHELCFKYYNIKRLQTIRQNQTAIYYRSKNYEEALSNSLGDLLYIYRQDPQENKVFFKSMIVIIVTSLIYLERYEEALEKVELFFEFQVEDFYDQALLLKRYCYYKLNDETGYQSLKAQEDKLLNGESKSNNIYDTLATLIDMLNRKNKKEMRLFGEKLKPLTKDTMSPYLKLIGLLIDDYTVYLKEVNRYVDVLDMK